MHIPRQKIQNSVGTASTRPPASLQSHPSQENIMADDCDIPWKPMITYGLQHDLQPHSMADDL